jgi:hypothetical protein
MKRFRIRSLMLLIVIAALVTALVVERRRAQQIALARATAKLEQLWDDPTIRNLRSEAKQPSHWAKSDAAKDQR